MFVLFDRLNLILRKIMKKKLFLQNQSVSIMYAQKNLPHHEDNLCQLFQKNKIESYNCKRQNLKTIKMSKHYNFFSWPCKLVRLLVDIYRSVFMLSLTLNIIECVLCIFL